MQTKPARRRQELLFHRPHPKKKLILGHHRNFSIALDRRAVRGNGKQVLTKTESVPLPPSFCVIREGFRYETYIDWDRRTNKGARAIELSSGSRPFRRLWRKDSSKSPPRGAVIQRGRFAFLVREYGAARRGESPAGPASLMPFTSSCCAGPTNEVYRWFETVASYARRQPVLTWPLVTVWASSRNRSSLFLKPN